MSAPNFLVPDRHLRRATALCGGKMEERAISRRLALVTAPESGTLELEDQKFLDQFADRRMGVQIHRDPENNFKVRGTSMDYHGNDRPKPDLHRLAWRTQEGLNDGEGILIGVCETGVTDSPWLAGGYLASPRDFEVFDLVPSDQRLPAKAGHGTFVTGLILQQAPAAGVWVERVLDQQGEAFASEVVEAAIRLAERGVHILNLSLGCYADEPGFSDAMSAMVEDLHAINRNLVIVAAAGNREEGSKKDREFFPARLPSVVAVSALAGDVNDSAGPAWADWANRGDWVDFAANGTNLLSTYLDNTPLGEYATAPNQYDGWARWSGTSFASAIASGVIARHMTRMGTRYARDAVDDLRRHAPLIQADGDDPATPILERREWDQELLKDWGRPSGE